MIKKRVKEESLSASPSPSPRAQLVGAVESTGGEGGDPGSTKLSADMARPSASMGEVTQLPSSKDSFYKYWDNYLQKERGITI